MIRKSYGKPNALALWNGLCACFVHGLPERSLSIYITVSYVVNGSGAKICPFMYTLLTDIFTCVFYASQSQPKSTFTRQLAAWRNQSITTGFPDIRWAQTSNYGYVPNPSLPNVFMAVSMDLPDYTSPYGAYDRDNYNIVFVFFSKYCLNHYFYNQFCVIHARLHKLNISYSRIWSLISAVNLCILLLQHSPEIQEPNSITSSAGCTAGGVRRTRPRRPGAVSYTLLADRAQPRCGVWQWEDRPGRPRKHRVWGEAILYPWFLGCILYCGQVVLFLVNFDICWI